MSINIKRLIVALSSMVVAGAVYAESEKHNMTIETIVNNIINNLFSSYAIWNLVYAICYISGIYFLIKAVLMLKRNNESKGGDKSSDFTNIVITIIASVMLMSLPTVIMYSQATLGFDGSSTAVEEYRLDTRGY